MQKRNKTIPPAIMEPGTSLILKMTATIATLAAKYMIASGMFCLRSNETEEIYFRGKSSDPFL
jgi:hypothetical protein